MKAEIDRIPVDLQEIESSKATDLKYSNSRQDGKGSANSRIQQESESFLASLHSTPGHDLSSGLQNMSSQFNKIHKFDSNGPNQ